MSLLSDANAGATLDAQAAQNAITPAGWAMRIGFVGLVIWAFLASIKAAGRA